MSDANQWPRGQQVQQPGRGIARASAVPGGRRRAAFGYNANNNDDNDAVEASLSQSMNAMSIGRYLSSQQRGTHVNNRCLPSSGAPSTFAPIKTHWQTADCEIDVDEPLPNMPPLTMNFPFDGIRHPSNHVWRIDYEELTADPTITDIAEQDLLNVKDVRPIASYNWLHPHQYERMGLPFGTMVIPGAPRLYCGDNANESEIPVHKWFISDPNAYHSPEYPMEPVFRAIDICHNSLNYQDSDIMADSNVLRMIYYYCNNKLKLSRGAVPCRIDLERVGQLVIMQRYEKEPVRFLEGGGHGIGFKRVITRPVSGLTAGIHQSVLSYNLGRLRIICNTKVDAAVKAAPAGMTAVAKKQFFQNDTHGYYWLTKLLSKDDQNSPPIHRFQDSTSKLRYIKHGSSNAFYEPTELLTTKDGRRIEWHRFWANEYFAAVKQFVRGNILMDDYDGRVFLKSVDDHSRMTLPLRVRGKELVGNSNGRPVPLGLRDDIRSNMQALRETHFLLRKIVEFMRNECPEGQLRSIVFEDGKPMKIFVRDGEVCPKIVPDECRMRIAGLDA